MKRLLVQAILTSLLIIPTLMWYFGSVKTTSVERWRRPRVAPHGSGVWALENPDVAKPFLTYGANQEAPQFMPQGAKGARVLILAYAR